MRLRETILFAATFTAFALLPFSFAQTTDKYATLPAGARSPRPPEPAAVVQRFGDCHSRGN